MGQKQIYLISGRPGSGKTTAVRKIVAQLQLAAGGFYTQELREAGRRQGFELVTLDGQRGIMAHVDLKGMPRIGKYGVDLEVIDAIGVPAVQRGIQAQLLVIDEIGPMEILSRAFREAVREALERDVLVVGTIVQRSTPFTDDIKTRRDVALFELTPQNRETVVQTILASASEVAFGGDG